MAAGLGALDDYVVASGIDGAGGLLGRTHLPPAPCVAGAGEANVIGGRVALEDFDDVGALSAAASTASRTTNGTGSPPQRPRSRAARGR